MDTQPPIPDRRAKTPETISEAYLRFSESIKTGQGEVSSAILKESFQKGEISEKELGKLAFDLLERVEQDNGIDPLTGVFNRGPLMSKLEGFLEEFNFPGSKREPAVHSLMVIVLDMNFLKVLNDTYGHKAGDQGLVALVDVLKKHFRKENVIARIGGDEFVVVVPIYKDLGDKTGEVHNDILGRLRTATDGLSIRFNDAKDDSIDFPIVIAMGSATVQPKESATDLLHRADQEMYKDKAEIKKSRDFLTRGPSDN